jgi:hypothetical protein
VRTFAHHNQLNALPRSLGKKVATPSDQAEQERSPRPTTPKIAGWRNRQPPEVTDMSELFIPTARNSERFANRPAPDYGKAIKYTPRQVLKVREDDRQTAIRKARALREVYRLERHIDVNFTGTTFDRGCLRILEQMLTVREAENIDVLFMRDRILAGLIEGAWVFESITRTAYGHLCDLRHNAFDLRYKELMP